MEVLSNLWRIIIYFNVKAVINCFRICGWMACWLAGGLCIVYVVGGGGGGGGIRKKEII